MENLGSVGRQEKEPENKQTDNHHTPDCFDVSDYINAKNRHLINVSKPIAPIGVNTICSTSGNYDIKGIPPNPKFVVSPWINSTIEPDTDNLI